ncbi:hypothetical protein EV130_105277 [Rhizobium azibense]|uniref:Uncharacterized protein n=1 Tax=Rhizobium azibense TaxID=1136135 RepID=A0A4R3RXV4_9HYPH|nr:hypothetical protein EV130_105277 [Rhizobium azibense]TCU40094.1 hypothetical protein EV129_102231 [Rhizobium azibense]
MSPAFWQTFASGRVYGSPGAARHLGRSEDFQHDRFEATGDIKTGLVPPICRMRPERACKAATRRAFAWRLDPRLRSARTRCALRFLRSIPARSAGIHVLLCGKLWRRTALGDRRVSQTPAASGPRPRVPPRPEHPARFTMMKERSAHLEKPISNRYYTMLHRSSVQRS